MATQNKKSQRNTPTRRRSSTAGKHRNANPEFLLDVFRRVSEAETLDQKLTTIVGIVSEALNVERSSIFLEDKGTGELYSRVAQGNLNQEIRILNNTGVAGYVFTTGKGLFIADAYADTRFDPTVDKRTGFTTSSILCTPIKTATGETFGVAQAMNKQKGVFNQDDLLLLAMITEQTAIFLQSSLFVETMEKLRAEEAEFLGVVSEISSEIQLGPLLQKIMAAVTKMVNAERSTLFLNDEKTNELYTEIGQGLGATKIRFPNHLGIAGTVFQTRNSVNIPYAYADLRFNPSFDKETGFFTRSILCTPVVNKNGKTIGVTQVLNKVGGSFGAEDEARLKAFTAQISIGIENAKLFDDVQKTKNYVESILESMSNGVITLDEERNIVTCNAAGLRILQTSSEEIIGQQDSDFFTGSNTWVVERITHVESEQKVDITMDAELQVNDERASVNVTVLPLVSAKDVKPGSMVLMEDITSEKRVKSTMSRYMDPALADRLLASGEEILGGHSSEATALFSDIRGFTSLTEELGAQGTVTLLNEYFTIMVDCIQQEGGMLDKFIGDAIMAVFGTPLPHGDDEDRAVRAGIAMLRDLSTYNHARAVHGKQPIEMGIGINTGLIVSGNIGSPKRMDFTVIGDGINLASRLESACKQYAAQLLISEHTLKKLRGIYQLREIDRVVVKGKTEPVSIHEVLDYHSEETFPNLMEVLNHFKDGVTKYRKRKWDKAIGAFQEALRLNEKDRILQIYIDRCNHYRKTPPPEEWTGVWTMTSK
ncbi:MAG: adenylate/guanylate cyclase domain-containing protein [Acidobacteriota bacterium]